MPHQWCHWASCSNNLPESCGNSNLAIWICSSLGMWPGKNGGWELGSVSGMVRELAELRLHWPPQITCLHDWDVSQRWEDWTYTTVIPRRHKVQVLFPRSLNNKTKMLLESWFEYYRGPDPGTVQHRPPVAPAGRKDKTDREAIISLTGVGLV